MRSERTNQRIGRVWKESQEERNDHQCHMLHRNQEEWENSIKSVDQDNFNTQKPKYKILRNKHT